MNKNLINELKEVLINNYELVARRDLKGQSINDMPELLNDIEEAFEYFNERLEKHNRILNGMVVPYIDIASITIYNNGEITIDSKWSNQPITTEWIEAITKLKTIVDKYSK